MGTVDPGMKRRRRTPRRKAASAGGPAPLREHKDWPAFCAVIIEALRRYPEAQDAVEEALRRQVETKKE
jgi:hypothetical protein